MILLNAKSSIKNICYEKKQTIIMAVHMLTFIFSAKAQNIVVQTEAGKVRGKISEGISVFKSIPYAAPPVGSLRFAAPAKPEKWDGIRDALKFGPTPPSPYQPKKDGIDETLIYGKGWIKGDNYLTANVWTPDVHANHLPVMV